MMNTEKTFLYTEYNLDQLNQNHGCVDSTEDDYVVKTCSFVLEYKAIESGFTLLEVGYTVCIKLPSSGVGTVITNAQRIYKHLCDCEILPEYPLTVDVYHEDCLTAWTSAIPYGSNICLHMHTSHNLAKTYKLHMTSILMAYDDAVGQTITTELANVVYNKEDALGYTKVKLPMTVSAAGLTLQGTVILQQPGRRLMLSGGGRVLTGGKISEGNGLTGYSPKLDVVKASSDGKALVVTLVSLLAMVMAAVF
jgi:hypothetical protein